MLIGRWGLSMEGQLCFFQQPPFLKLPFDVPSISSLLIYYYLLEVFSEARHRGTSWQVEYEHKHMHCPDASSSEM